MSLLTGNPVWRRMSIFTARHYARIINDPYYHRSDLDTIRKSGSDTLIALVIGYPLAHGWRGSKSRAGACAIADGGADPDADRHRGAHLRLDGAALRQGCRQSDLISSGLISQPLKLMYNETGIIIGLVHIYVPFMVLDADGRDRRIDERLEQAAEKSRRQPGARLP